MTKTYDSNDLKEKEVLQRVGELLPEMLANSVEAILFATNQMSSTVWVEFCELEKKHCYDIAVDQLVEELNENQGSHGDEHADWLGAS